VKAESDLQMEAMVSIFDVVMIEFRYP
jgi:hypothetical protein